MITAYFLNLATAILGILLSWLPDANTLPTIYGIDTDYYFRLGIQYTKFLAEIFPPLQTIIIATGVYLTWRLTLLTLRMILGSRTPHVH